MANGCHSVLLERLIKAGSDRAAAPHHKGRFRRPLDVPLCAPQRAGFDALKGSVFCYIPLSELDAL